LPDNVKRGRGLAAEGLFDQRFGHIDAAAREPQRVGIGVGKLMNDVFLLFAAQPTELGDFDRDLLDLLGGELRHELHGLLLGQAHQQDRGFAEVGHGRTSNDEVQMTKEIRTSKNE